MKILLASGTDSGIKRGRSELISELLSMGHEVCIATQRGNAIADLEKMGCHVYCVDIERHGKNPFQDIKLYFQFKNILSKIKPDIVLTFTTKPNIYCAMAARNLKMPVIMNITGMGTALSSKGLLQNLLIKMYRYAVGGKNIKCIFFQNDYSAEFFKENEIGDPAVFKRIPGSGINLDRYPVLPYPEDADIHFLFVGRVMIEKGIREYIEAVGKVKKKYSNTVFHVLGACDSDYGEKLKAACDDGIIIYHGQVDNMLDYQKISSCTIQPSFYPEGMSNVILEAAACGRPVITTDHPGCREGVDDGITGYIVPPRNVDALASAIERMVELTPAERKAMGENGRKKMEAEFDRRIVTNAYLTEISKLQRG